MKLNDRIDSYDIKSMSNIESAVIKMKNHCDKMEMLGGLLKHNIAVARDAGFQSINCDRAEEIINEYCKNLSGAREEFLELSDSVKKFIDKINDIWNTWV
jgi:hypothetical protein